MSLQSNSLSNNANKIDNDNRISTENATDNEMNLKAPKSHINDEDILLNGVRSKFVKLTREASKTDLYFKHTRNKAYTNKFPLNLIVFYILRLCYFYLQDSYFRNYILTFVSY